MLWFNYLMQPFVFSVTQLEINFSHQQWSCVKVYLNKLVKLKVTFSHSNLENNFWFENAKQQLCFFYYCCCYLNIKLLKNVLFPNMHFWKKNTFEQKLDYQCDLKTHYLHLKKKCGLIYWPHERIINSVTNQIIV